MPISTTLRAALLPGLLWLWLFAHLHYEWTLNEQYNYGWAVPFLGALLFYQRWQTRPPPDEPFRKPAASALRWALLLLLLPIRVVEEANPDWRLLSWILGLVVVAFAFLSVSRLGGRSWARHFAFPLCFPLVAVPWLVQIENTIVQSLTRAVAAVAVEIAGWSGVGAYQLGNIIQLKNGFVGVDEACSGVKTLQAAIMVSLFLGELMRLRASRRVLLLIGGCGWVFACNIMRATALVVIAASRGLAALKEWHDLIGTAVLVIGMGGLVGLALLLMQKQGDEGGAISRLPRQNWGALESAPLWRMMLPIAWLVLIFAATEAWYRFHERQLIARPHWDVSWPAVADAQEAPIAETTRAILRYNEATSAAWENPRGVFWWGFFARWQPQRAALQLVRSHSPEICLPAAGRIFRAELAPLTVQFGGLSLAFRAFEFEQNERPLFVFVCIQEDKVTAGAADAPQMEWNARGRLLAAWRGQRNLGQRLLEVAVTGQNSVPEAHQALSQNLRDALRVQPKG
ncbi:MAG: exosortase/archaeosortase family protein [Chthoniobacterales bacterium]